LTARFRKEFRQAVKHPNARPRHRPNPDARLAGTICDMKKTNFDLYLEKQLQDPVFAQRFEQAGEGWDVALQLAALREKAGLSQKELARKLKTSQQQISRLESPSYEGHSLSMLRRVAAVLGASVRVSITSRETAEPMILAESRPPYRVAQNGPRQKARGGKSH
jgi:DNA-binding XRE family transcriptional regulator